MTRLRGRRIVDGMSAAYSHNYPPTRYDYGPAEPVRRSAPASVHVVALIQYFVGLLLLAAGAAAGWFAVATPRGASPDLPVDLTGAGLAVGAVLVFAGLVVIAIGRKLQRGKRWARALVLALSVVGIVTTLYDGLVAHTGNSNVLGGLVLPVVYLVLLNLPAARSWYRNRTY